MDLLWSFTHYSPAETKTSGRGKGGKGKGKGGAMTKELASVGEDPPGKIGVMSQAELEMGNCRGKMEITLEKIQIKAECEKFRKRNNKYPWDIQNGGLLIVVLPCIFDTPPDLLT